MRETRTKLPHTILAQGEHTGHRHEVHGPGVALYDDGREGILLLDVPDGTAAVVTHPEHHPQSVAPGHWDRLIVREYDHFLEESRQVRD